MTTPEQARINALRFALSQRIDAAATAQANLFAEQRRQGLTLTPGFYTADEMDAVNAAARIELREIVAASIADARYLLDRTYKPDKQHQAWIAFAASFAAEAKRAKAPAANVVQLPTGQTAEQIIAAGRRRRNEV
jgi:hypothetical protein